MKIVFFGSSHFAVPGLTALIQEGYSVCAVVTQPDRKQGRGLLLGHTHVKTVASECGLLVYQPADVNSPESVKFLSELHADLFVVIAYGQKLSAQLLEMPKLFCLNVHASLLPLYRGAAPVNYAVINGDKLSGLSVMKMVKKMDAGPVCLQKVLPIASEDDALTLENNLSNVTGELLIELLSRIKDNNLEFFPQDEAKATFARKLRKEDGLIRWDNPGKVIHNLVRGCLPWPGAFTSYKGKLLKIYKTKIMPVQEKPQNIRPGSIIDISNHGLVVSCRDNEALRIEELQIEGKRRMPVSEFITGHKVAPGEKLGV